MAQSKWTAENIPGQQGKTILITGANSGLGLQSATVLSQKGATVIMAVRNMSKGKEALAKIKSSNPTARIELMELDLSDLDSIKKFSEAFHAKYSKLNALLNNAGIMAPPQREITKQGSELQFCTNYLGHFALTGRLLDIIKNTPKAVIATQSSTAHKAPGADVHFDDLDWEKSYNKWGAYAQSKLALLLFTYELDRQFKANNIDAVATAAHPGWTITNLQKSAGFFFDKVMGAVLGQKVEIGVLDILRAATDKDIKGAEFFGPTKWMGMKGYPEKIKSSNKSYDESLSKKLWEVSEKLTTIHYDFKR